jgi:hypothetical protein
VLDGPPRMAVGPGVCRLEARTIVSSYAYDSMVEGPELHTFGPVPCDSRVGAAGGAAVQWGWTHLRMAVGPGVCRLEARTIVASYAYGSMVEGPELHTFGPVPCDSRVGAAG